MSGKSSGTDGTKVTPLCEKEGDERTDRHSGMTEEYVKLVSKTTVCMKWRNPVTLLQNISKVPKQAKTGENWSDLDKASLRSRSSLFHGAAI